MSKAFTHLMFQGNARAALETYQAVFPDFAVDMLELNGDDTRSPGTVRMAKVSFAGQNRLWDTAQVYGPDERVRVYTDPRPPYGRILLTLRR